MVRIPAAITCAAVASACGGSALIARDDDTYRRSIAHYQRTRQLVAASLAADDEQAMFMQAESLYRYRFAPERSSGAVFAEVAASVIDLPALQAVAGSLDLEGLRLQAPDGAAQIWESLLVFAPSTKLRDLTLYRLGWAYRNTRASGLPRDSNAAFDALAHGESPLSKLAADARATPWKSTGAATAWSIIPGAGQIYVGATGSGIARLAIGLAAATAVIVPSVLAYQRRSELSFDHDWPLLATGVGGAIVLTIDYSSSYDDALRRVLQYNEASEAAFEAARPEAP